MDRIILTIVLVGGYLALVVAANVEAPAPAQATAATIVSVPASADADERRILAAATDEGGSWTADAAERTLTSSFDRLPKPTASR